MNSDCILIMGSNAAECHPVAFQWVVEAQARGAKVIHVDPRFTRTSAVSDVHVPIRAGTDIAFLGGLIHHVLEGGHVFREYVAHYTNAGVQTHVFYADPATFEPSAGRLVQARVGAEPHSDEGTEEDDSHPGRPLGRDPVLRRNRHRPHLDDHCRPSADRAQRVHTVTIAA